MKKIKRNCDLRGRPGESQAEGLQQRGWPIWGQWPLPHPLFSSGPSDWQGLCLLTPLTRQQIPEDTFNSDFYCTQVKTAQTRRQWQGNGMGGGLWVLRVRSPACLSSVPVETRRVVRGSPGDSVGQGPKPPLTSSNPKFSSSSEPEPTRHSQIRSPHSSEFLQLPRGAVGRRQRVRSQAAFRLGPGFQDEDSDALGRGSVFTEVNRAGGGMLDLPGASAL